MAVVESMSQLTKFGIEILARLKGQDDKAKALKIERQCKNLLRTQVSTLEVELAKLENQKEEAEEILHDAIYPSEFPGDRYPQSILDAKSHLLTIEEEIENYKNTQKIYQEILDK